MSIFKQTPTRGLARRSCAYCSAWALPGMNVCGAHMGEDGRIARDPRRAGYKTASYRIARAAAIARADGRCESCGSALPTKPDGSVICQAHHIDGNPLNNPVDGSNLLICGLCCHRGAKAPR